MGLEAAEAAAAAAASNLSAAKEAAEQQARSLQAQASLFPGDEVAGDPRTEAEFGPGPPPGTPAPRPKKKLASKTAAGVSATPSNIATEVLSGVASDLQGLTGGMTDGISALANSSMLADGRTCQDAWVERPTHAHPPAAGHNHIAFALSRWWCGLRTRLGRAREPSGRPSAKGSPENPVFWIHSWTKGSAPMAIVPLRHLLSEPPD